MQTGFPGDTNQAARKSAAQEKTKMESNEKQLPAEGGTLESQAFRVPSSLEEAYELGWQWERESFVGLREFGTTKGVVRREGLAYFVSERETDGIVIPFVATYEFGTPRQPKYPYESGSVFSVDEEPPRPVPQQPKTPEELEEERVSLWKVDQLYQGKVIGTVQVRGPREGAWDEAMGLLSDEMETQISEVTDQTSIPGAPTAKDEGR
jgi:hypothetical protein